MERMRVQCAVSVSKGSDDKEKGSRIIGKLLPAAVRLWLRSQVEQVGELSIELAGRDRQIISGYIPGVSIAADEAVYQGLHVSQVVLSAEDIRINIGQVLRGKPLKLLKSFLVSGGVTLSDEGLTASLNSALLTNGLRDFWRSLLQHPGVAQAVEARYGLLPLREDVVLSRPDIRLGDGCLGLSFYPALQDEIGTQPIVFGADIAVESGHFLKLTQPRWLATLSELENPVKGIGVDSLDNFCWDLGRDTQLSELVLTRSQLLCKGQVMVIP
ncbi:MAG: DUF2993 domain-containing protein [Cyanobacteria bacterium J06607_10]